jgi:hypothetical protein
VAPLNSIHGLKTNLAARRAHHWCLVIDGSGEYAATEGIGYLDYYSAMVNDQHGLKAKFSGDGVHPNEAGYTIMAPLVADAIAKSKLQPSKKSP